MNIRTVNDQMGRIVNVPTFPKKIISLVPSQTELLHYLGLEEEVIGITKFCIHPNDWFRNKARIGGTKTAHIQKIINLKPDLIIANKEENNKEQIEELEKYFPVWLSDIVSLEDAFLMMEQIGDLVGKKEKATLLSNNLRSQFADLQKDFPVFDKSPKVAYFIWQNPYMVAARGTFIDEILKVGGFHNLFSHLDRYPQVTSEDLQKLNPELIFLSSEPFPFKDKHIEAFRQLCPSATVKLVDGELFSWYGNRLLESCAYLRNLRDS